MEGPLLNSLPLEKFHFTSDECCVVGKLFLYNLQSRESTPKTFTSMFSDNGNNLADVILQTAVGLTEPSSGAWNK